MVLRQILKLAFELVGFEVNSTVVTTTDAELDQHGDARWGWNDAVCDAPGAFDCVLQRGHIRQMMPERGGSGVPH
jgi:hypothetical protein